MNATAPSENSTPKSRMSVPYKFVQTLVDRKATGSLTIADPKDESVKWRIYFGDGKIHFATSAMGQRERMNYLLGRCFKSKIYLPPELTSEYQYICSIWQAGRLSTQQVRKILGILTQEAFIQALVLPQAVLEFDKAVGLDPLLLSLPIDKLVLSVRPQIRQWVKVRSEISSPFQRPQIQDLEKITGQTWIDSGEYQFIEQLFNQFLHENMCLYEIASRLSKTTLELAAFMQPLVNIGGIKMNPYQQKKSEEGTLIACIDDSKGIQTVVKKTLEASGFQVLSIVEPAKALTTFIKHKPALILMDINMPQIDGYELCRMLQQSALLKDIPIIMLTGRDGLIDRIKARMVGAVSYICKPFNPQELVDMVNSHLKIGNVVD